MYKKIIDVLRFTLISSEVVVGVLIYCSLSYFDEFTRFIADMMIQKEMDTGSILALFGIPIALTILTFKLGYELLSPHELLKKWPDYWMLKYRVVFSFLVAVIGFLGSVVCWYYANKISKIEGTAFLLSIWAVTAVSLLSIGWAKIQRREILEMR